MSPFHAGEIEVQSRLLAREAAERVGQIVASEIVPAVQSLLRSQRMAVAASLDESGRPWTSLLTGPSGFIEAVDDRLLRIAAAPSAGDPLGANLRARPELGLLVIDAAAVRQRVHRARLMLRGYLGDLVGVKP